MPKPKRTGLEEEQQPYESGSSGLASVAYARLKIDTAGRVVIPAEMRAAMLVKPGDTVTAEVVEGEFRIVSPDVALTRFQAIGREWQKNNPGVDLVEDLIAERREEAKREDEKYDRLAREAAEIAADRRNRK